MGKQEPTFRIVVEKDLTYTVEIREPGMIRRITEFRRQEDAEEWVARSRERETAHG